MISIAGILSIWVGITVALINLIWVFISLSQDSGAIFWHPISFAFVCIGIFSSGVIGYGFTTGFSSIIFVLRLLLGNKKSYPDRYCKKIIRNVIEIVNQHKGNKVAIIDSIERLAKKRKDSLLVYAAETMSVESSFDHSTVYD